MSHRLFVAVDPPPAVAAQLTAWARAARQPGLRPVAPGNVHLTLAFLGQQPAGDVSAIERAVEAAVAATALWEPIALETRGPVWLPPRRPRALALDVDDPTGGLGELRREVTAALERAIGWEDDRPRFRPHLTAGRISGPPDRGGLPAAPRLRFGVEAVTLYRSFLSPEGARYEALASAAIV